MLPLQSEGQAALLVANSNSKLFYCLRPCLLCDIWEGGSAAGAWPQRTHAETDCKNQLHVAAPRHEHKHIYSRVMKNTKTITLIWCVRC